VFEKLWNWVCCTFSIFFRQSTRPTCLYRTMSWSEDVPSSNRCSHRAPTLWQRNYTLLWVCQKVLRVLMVCLADATLDLWCNHRLLACNPGFFASSFRIFEKWYRSEVKRAEFWTEKLRHRTQSDYRSVAMFSLGRLCAHPFISPHLICPLIKQLTSAIPALNSRRIRSQ
jgi:hypothetical protein